VRPVKAAGKLGAVQRRVQRSRAGRSLCETINNWIGGFLGVEVNHKLGLICDLVLYKNTQNPPKPEVHNKSR